MFLVTVTAYFTHFHVGERLGNIGLFMICPILEESHLMLWLTLVCVQKGHFF